MTCEIENSEADGKQLRARVVRGSGKRHDLDGRAKRYGISLQTIGLSSQDGLDVQRMGRRRQYLVVVHEEAIALGGEVQRLFNGQHTGRPGQSHSHA